MAYLVNITARAERDLAHLFVEINAEYSDAALKWYFGLKEAILSLEQKLLTGAQLRVRMRISGTCSMGTSLTSIA
jgi:hypothetical protein